MINETPQIINNRAGRNFVKARYVITVEARNLSTMAIEKLAIWDGTDDDNIPTEDGTLFCYGAGRLIEVPEFVSQIGLDVINYQFRLSQTDDVINTLIRGYETRLAPVKIYRLEYNSSDNYIVGSGRRIFTGFIDTIAIETAAVGGEGSVTVNVISESHSLTNYGTLLKNHEFQKKRGGDMFRKYSTITMSDIPWGQKRKHQPSSRFRDKLLGR